MFELNSEMRFKTGKHGQGIFIRDKINMYAWGINKNTVIECPVSFGNVSENHDRFDVGSIGAFTYINGRPHNRFPYRTTNIDAQSIGSFCIIAQDVQIGVGEHPLRPISASSVWSSGNAWTENYYTSLDAGRWLSEMDLRYRAELSDKRRLPVIGNDVWVGLRATVLNGVTVGDGAVIAAGSTVVNDVPPYTVAGGVPAKPIKQRFDDKTTEMLLKLKWWEYGPDVLVGIDIYEPSEAVKYIEERIANGFPKYEADSFEFNWERNTVYRITNKKREFYAYCDRL